MCTFSDLLIYSKDNKFSYDGTNYVGKSKFDIGFKIIIQNLIPYEVKDDLDDLKKDPSFDIAIQDIKITQPNGFNFGWFGSPGAIENENPVTIHAGEKYEASGFIRADLFFSIPEIVESSLETISFSANIAGETQNMDTTFRIKNMDYKAPTTDETEPSAEKAAEELQSLGSIGLKADIMKEIFGIEGKSLRAFEQEILTEIIMCSAPDETFKEALGNKVIEKVFGRYKADVSQETYTVPLQYMIESPTYGKLKVRFDCRIQEFDLRDTKFAFIANISYTVLKQQKISRLNSDDILKLPNNHFKSQYLGGATYNNVKAFADAAWELAEEELKKAYKPYGDDADKAADILLSDTVKKIMDAADTSASDLIWKIATWPTTELYAKSSTETRSTGGASSGDTVASGQLGKMLAQPVQRESIACPTNLYVLNAAGEVCGAIEDNVVTKSNDSFTLSVDDDVMHISDLEDDYTVRYVPTENSAMDVTVVEMLGYNEPYRTLEFKQVPLSENIAYTQTIPKETLSEVEMYKLVSENNDIVLPDTDTLSELEEPEIEKVKVIFVDEKSGKEPVTIEVTYGNTADTANPSASGFVFQGWSETKGGEAKYTSTNPFKVPMDNPKKEYTLYACWKTAQTDDTDSPDIDTNNSGNNNSYSSSPSVSVSKAENGSVSLSPSKPKKGETVTITVTPDNGYELSALTVKDSSGKEISTTKKDDGKYTFTMPSGKVTITPAFTKAKDKSEDESTQQPSISFTDISSDAYYTDAVAWTVAQGITKGTTETTFSPDNSCTRAQMVTFLWRSAGFPSPSNSDNPFTDVLAGTYYYDAVLWAVEHGITTGTTDTTFSPDNTVTRGQTVTFMYRNAGSSKVNTVSPFADVASDAYYADAVVWAASNDITKGTTGTTFSPNESCTRAQIVTFLYRKEINADS